MPFCRVAHAGTSSIEGFIACLGLQTGSGMRRPMEMASQMAALPWNSRLPARQAPGPASIPGVPWSFFSKDPKCPLSLAQPLSPITQ